MYILHRNAWLLRTPFPRLPYSTTRYTKYNSHVLVASTIKETCTQTSNFVATPHTVNAADVANYWEQGTVHI